jgi:glycerol-3-phosphate acyltransferase PlsX
MSSRIIALDAMGGDVGPEVVIPGAALSLVRHPDVRYLLVGDQDRITPVLQRHPDLAARSSVLHTATAIGMQDKPSFAVRRGKGTSMWLALEAVQSGQAEVAVSAGNTGALMALSRLLLRPLSGIERPAIAALWPTVRNECIVLDVGANIGASARQLCDYALMGAAMARALFQVERPSVGLLNVDVVVVEGFTGNIALKTAEGTARQISQYLRDAMRRTLLARAGAFLAQGGFRVLKRKMDPRRVNGGTFLGLSGLAIKSHGGTDALGFASAVDLGYDMAESGLLKRLAADIETFHGKLTTGASG